MKIGGGGGQAGGKQNAYTRCALSVSLVSSSVAPIKWQEFKVGDLFTKIELKKLNPLDSRRFRSRTRKQEYIIPAVVAKRGNNGVMYYVGLNDYETATNKLVVIANGAVASGLVYYHEDTFTILHDAYALDLRQHPLNKERGLFLATTLQNKIFKLYDYNNKPTWNKIMHETIPLPVHKDGTIAYDLMESFIKALEKQHIDKVKQKWGTTLNAYERVLDTPLKPV
ncbi:restriction endonuclease subunit S [Helicobacter vulpis]|uniref:restriction endonuclease subunit S n=1 Tax=Helicobacter vulpis TaxID=2316076 RepID=UPI0013CE2464|nr:restriction endonuclease subunit S [Helicobacter vulpis]